MPPVRETRDHKLTEEDESGGGGFGGGGDTQSHIDESQRGGKKKGKEKKKTEDDVKHGGETSDILRTVESMMYRTRAIGSTEPRVLFLSDHERDEHRTIGLGSSETPPQPSLEMSLAGGPREGSIELSPFIGLDHPSGYITDHLHGG